MTTEFLVVDTTLWQDTDDNQPTNQLRIQPDRAARNKGNSYLDKDNVVEYATKNLSITNQPNQPDNARIDRTELNPTPGFPSVGDIHKLKIGHSGFGTGAYSDVSEPTLINQSEVCNLFYKIGNPNLEESMRHHASPVHDDHAFVQLIRTIDPQPEFQALADFIRFTRKIYQNGKFLKKYV